MPRHPRGNRQHTLPAFHIGQWGLPSDTGKTRDRQVYWYSKRDDAVHSGAAHSVNWYLDIYRFDLPKIHHNMIDLAFGDLERLAADAIRHIVAETVTFPDQAWLSADVHERFALAFYIATLRRRAPRFLEHAATKWTTRRRASLLAQGLVMMQDFDWRSLNMGSVAALVEALTPSPILSIKDAQAAPLLAFLMGIGDAVDLFRCSWTLFRRTSPPYFVLPDIGAASPGRVIPGQDLPDSFLHRDALLVAPLHPSVLLVPNPPEVTKDILREALVTKAFADDPVFRMNTVLWAVADSVYGYEADLLMMRKELKGDATWTSPVASR